ncbi:MAG: TonB family protein [Acidobacteria bacterium]|nr:TonB family protein [Acidobacteriota bacterium]
MFDKLLDSAPRRGKTRKPSTLVVSVVLHSSVLLTLVVVPLFMPDLLESTDLLMFVSSPPPAETWFPEAKVKPPQERPPDAGPEKPDDHLAVPPEGFQEPTAVTETVPDIDRRPALPVDDNADVGIPIGGPGQDPAGTPGIRHTGIRVPDAVIDLPSAPPVPRETPPASTGPALFRSELLASKLIHRVEPAYPELARRSRTQGVVILKIVVGVDGKVASVTPVSGNPLLVPAAVDAVLKWVYSPTTLNALPVEITGTVVVNFVLRQ